MEILAIVLLLLMRQNDGSDLKSTVNEALSFYKENKELIKMLSTMMGGEAVSAPPPPKQSEPSPTQYESSSDGRTIFEEYLKAHPL